LEARVIAKSKLATAMIDSSDGLVRSVLELGKASKVGALIYGPEVPIAKGATWQQALNGGEEYELVFTAPMSAVPKLRKLLKKTKLSVVGEIRPRKEGFVIMDREGRRAAIKTGGYEHFRG
jgi:thiamine-monophosphate kinase